MNNKQGSHNGSASSHGNHRNKDKHHVPRDVTTIASPQPTLEPNLPAQQQAASTSEQFGLLGSTEMASGGRDSICDTCRRIDFQDLLQNPRQAEFLWVTGETSPHTMRYSDGCKLCSLMFKYVPLGENTLELRSYSFKKMSRWRWEIDPNACDIVLLRISQERIGGSSNYYPLDDVFCKLASDGPPHSYCAQPVEGIWDCVKARLWLDTCTRCHGSVCEQELIRIPGMNLIDCEDMVVVEAAQEMRWLALSYVWGANCQTEGHAGYRAGSSISLDIPRTVADAISVTLQLGYRYLWVDEYCIDQNDENHRDDQIKRMDRIYHGADLTIVAAAGENKSHGLPGLGSTKRGKRKVVCVGDVVVFSNGPDPYEEAKNSPWFTRAWTLQEAFLSKRMLVFTDHQMSFYCLSASWTEGLGNPDPNAARLVDKNHRPTHLLRSLVHLTSSHWNWRLVVEILETYSIRLITKEADTLDAFLGVMNHIRRSQPGTQFLRGLPLIKYIGKTSKVVSADYFNSFEELVAAALSWQSYRHAFSSHQRRSKFPSWTWAGWSGGASFWFLGFQEVKHRSVLRHARLESSSGQVVVSSTLYNNNIQDVLDTVMLIQFEAPMIPAASFSTDDSYDANEFRVSGRESFLKMNPDNYTPNRLIENVRRGIWSCFMLLSDGRRDEIGEDGSYSIFVLVIRWEADQLTAERIGSFSISSSASKDARLGLIQESWTWRRVRLI